VFGHAWPVSVGPSSPSSSRQRRSRWQTYLSGATATPTRSARRSEQKAGKPAALATLLRGHTADAPQAMRPRPGNTNQLLN